MDYSILEALNDQNEYPRKVRFPGPGKWISGILRISEVGFIFFPRVHTVSPQEVHRPGNLTFHENSFWPFRAATRSPCPFACVSGSRGSSARAASPKPPHVKTEFPNSSLRDPIGFRRVPEKVFPGPVHDFPSSCTPCVAGHRSGKNRPRVVFLNCV